MLRAPLILAMCIVLDAEPAWKKDKRTLLGAMQSFDFKGAFQRARSESGAQHFQTYLVGSITRHLAKTMKNAA